MLADQQARVNAIDPTRSCIVQAPAGSGKTTLLVARFLQLLENVRYPEACLAITFTKKAAAEMQYRVLAAIQDLVASNTVTDKLIYQQILADPCQLQILTIDALCSKIVSKIPPLDNVYFNYTIAADPELLYQTAVEQLLAELGEQSEEPWSKVLQQHLIILFRYFDNDYELIHCLLKNLLHKREQWLPLIMPLPSDPEQGNTPQAAANLRYLLENNLQLAITDILQQIGEHLPGDPLKQQLLSIAIYAANNIEDQENPIASLKSLHLDWPEPTYDALLQWQGLANLLFNKDGSLRTALNIRQGFLPVSKILDGAKKQLVLEYKALFKEVILRLEAEHIQFLQRLFKFQQLPVAKYQQDNWEVLSSLLQLLPSLVAHLSLVFADKQQLDFTQITMATLDALGSYQEPTALALAMQQQLKHILIDEFQDTSLLQYRMLEHLVFDWDVNDGNTIFIVGDPMQSIYRFRQADVSLFLKVQRYGIANIKLDNLFLSSNFRSTRSMITNINQLFSNIFPQEDDWVYHGIKYRSCYAAKQDNLSIDLSGLELNFLPQGSSLTTQDLQLILADSIAAETAAIVELIAKLQTFVPQLKIAVLFRARSHAFNLIASLQQDHIDYQSNDLELMLDHACIRDLHVLTKAIIHPNDMVAWLSLLRSPLVGLLLSDLNILFEGKTTEPLLESLKNYRDCALLSRDAVHRLNHVVPVLLDAITLQHSASLSIIIKRTWVALGGDLLVPAKDLYLIEDYLCNIAKLADPYDSFKLDQYVAKLQVGVNLEVNSTNKVQLMTIHKAKGLEFDIVILPRMNQYTANSRDPLLLWEERNLFSNTIQANTCNQTSCVLFASLKSSQQQQDRIYNFLKMTEAQKQMYEAQRVLYVAISRAKYKFFGFTASQDPANKSFLQALAPYVNPEQLVVLEAYHAGTAVDSSDKDKPAVDGVMIERLPTAWYIDKSIV